MPAQEETGEPVVQVASTGFLVLLWAFLIRVAMPDLAELLCQ